MDDIDSTIQPGKAKKEDLRIRDPSISGWEAIVEVKGYGHSAGKAQDLQKMQRFARFYLQEKGRLSEKMLYVVNTQFELPPDQRQAVLIGADEDVETFAEDGGLAIGTMDLFRLVRRVEEKVTDAAEARRLLREEAGRFVLPSIEGKQP